MPGYEDDETSFDQGRSLEQCEQATAIHFRTFIHAPEFRIVLAVFFLAFLSNFSYYCSELPLLRLIERTICEAYYADEGAQDVVATEIDESLCKIPRIQNKLALFMGYKTAFDAIPRIATPLPTCRLPSLILGVALLTSLWYGSLANRIGRRTIIALACTGELLNLAWVLFVCKYHPHFK